MNIYSKTVNKINGRSALGLIFSIGVLTASTNAQAALWGLFGDDQEPLKTDKRSPALNNSVALTTAPDPNLVYGSMPAVQPIDYNVSPNPLVMQPPMEQVQLNSPSMQMPSFNVQPPQYNVPPQPDRVQPKFNATQVPMQITPPQMPAPMVMQSMPTQPMMPQPMPMASGSVTPPAPPSDELLFAAPKVPVQQFQTVPVQPQAAAPYAQPDSSNLGSDGWPKLSSMRNQPVPQPVPSNARADKLKEELNTSKTMAGFPIIPAQPQPAPMGVNVKNELPVISSANQPPMLSQPVPVQPMPAQPLPMASQSFPPQSNFAPLPPAQFTPVPAQTASNVQPVFPSGPSVTVRSKHAGSASVNQPTMAQAPMPMATQPVPYTPAPLANNNADIAVASPTPLVETTHMPAPVKPVATAFAPEPIAPKVIPEIKKQRVVNEASTPVASAYDTPIDYGTNGTYNANYMNNNGLSNTSYTVGATGRNYGRPALLPKSRYENYRKNIKPENSEQ